MIFEPQGSSGVDEEHLRVLAVLYFVYGGLAACLGLAALLFLAVGMMVGAAGSAASSSPWGGLGAASGGCVLAVVGGGLFLLFSTVAALRILTGVALRQHRHRTFCMVVAALTALEVPIGALLGVATLIVLLRPTVERLFDADRRPPPPAAAAAAGPPVIR
jgi:hypothetical protein